jgi:signal transduction histidine kinase
VEIYADRTRLRQVMINLVNNAIKFTEAGQVSLKVTLPGASVDRGPDTGIGIDKLDAIFQNYASRCFSTRKAGGTGLGSASISRRLVEMHGAALLKAQEFPEKVHPSL